MRIVFMGSPEFALPALRRLIESEHEIAGVVTQPDEPAGRGRRLRAPPVKELAVSHGLRVLQPERVNRPDALDELRALAPDAIVIAAYGQILKQPLLDIPTRGALNVHASLLPRHRGASPIAAAILAGDPTTGVSIMEVVLALDAGPVLSQRAIPIGPEDTTGSLTVVLSELGGELLVHTLPRWERGEIEPQPQDESLATYAPPLRRADAVIDWSLPAVEVWRRVRAYNPWPVATTTVDGETLRILEAWPLDEEPDAPPGTVLHLPHSGHSYAGRDVAGDLYEETFGVRCGAGTLAVLTAQRPGRNAMSGGELLRGWRGLAGKRLGS